MPKKPIRRQSDRFLLYTFLIKYLKRMQYPAENIVMISERPFNDNKEVYVWRMKKS